MEREQIDWLPRAVRRRVNLTGMARWEDGSSAKVLLSNISYQGCHLWSEHQLTCGETVTLILPRYGDMDAQVRWVVGDSAGVRFLTGSSAVDDRRARIGV